jgi:hypothetical protein
VIARITASEAAFNRSPEGQERRRIEDLEDKRRAAKQEGTRLTLVEANELKALRQKYPPPPPPPWLRDFWLTPGKQREREEATTESGPTSVAEAVPVAEPVPLDPDDEYYMPPEEGPPSWEARLYDLEILYFDQKLTPEEAKELEELRRQDPVAAEKLRKMVTRRLTEYYARRAYTRKLGYDPGPDDGWPRREPRRE